MSPAELERLYDAHADALYAFLLNLTRDEADTRDAMQDAFAQIAAGGRWPAGVRDARAWLLRLGHHAAVDRIRRREASRRAVEGWRDIAPAMFAEAADPDTTTFQDELAAGLGDLPPEQRAVVHLKLWERRSFEEIADLLEIPLNTAASRYRYGLEKLRDRLRPLYDEIRHATP
jgi:RNA polymerase sigma-70 factor, ECF subfamily